MEEDLKILEEFIKYYESEAISRKFRGTLSISVDQYDIYAIEHLIKAYKELEEENKRLKASHIVTHNKISDEEKAKIFDVIDNSIDTYFEKSKPYWEQIMTKDKMSLEEAETIINDMYQDRNKILENNNVIDISRLDDVKFTNLEFASVRAIREIQSLERKLENSIPVSLVEEKIEEIQKEYEETLKTANFKEIEKMNKINFRGITLEGQRSILRELLEKRK